MKKKLKSIAIAIFGTALLVVPVSATLVSCTGTEFTDFIQKNITGIKDKVAKEIDGVVKKVTDEATKKITEATKEATNVVSKATESGGKEVANTIKEVTKKT